MNSSAASVASPPAPSSLFIIPAGMWLAFLASIAALALALEPSLRSLLDKWFQSEEFSYGPILPFVCGFLIWQQRDTIEQVEFTGSWVGVALLTLSAGMALIGQLATVPSLAHLGIAFALAGLTFAMTGWTVFRRLIGAFAILILAIPLPAFLLNSLSLQMQLISSEIGVAIVRMFGISVFLEGNVIDLGVYKLEVAEACNGLRYLFPLMTLGFLMAYLFKVSMWKRVVLFLSSIPIAILMNSIRIGIIGVLVDRWGTAMAEGFLHEFQGWAVFMVSTAVMVVEMIVLARIGSARRPWREVFGLEFPPPRPRNATRLPRRITMPLVVATAVTVGLAAASLSTPKQAEIVPSRDPLLLFPTRIGPWTGQRNSIERVYLDTLKLSDYVIADYRSLGHNPVNFYIAWYDSQSGGQAAHSPRSCLPGGGWEIESLDQVEVPAVAWGRQSLRVNRALIAQGEQRQLTYYWFQQRGRVITNEYLVKWYLFWDALTRNRSDGALIRLVVPVMPGQSVEQADATLAQFLGSVAPELPRFVPD